MITTFFKLSLNECFTFLFVASLTVLATEIAVVLNYYYYYKT